MLCHDVGDILKHLKREYIEVRGTFITVSDSLSKRIEILIDISVELDTINTRNGGRCLEGHLLSVNLNLLNHTHTARAGNPAFKDKYSVSYMWEDILTKDTILDLISKFIFVEVKEKVDEETGKVKRSENLIFPRYHQLDVIRKILADVRENGTAQNYLIRKRMWKI